MNISPELQGCSEVNGIKDIERAYPDFQAMHEGVRIRPNSSELD